MMGVTQSKPADTALFDCLASRQRRAVLAVLDATPDDLSERELAARTAAELDGTAPDDVSDDECERVHVALHHRHLPKLATVDLVEHDREERRVAIADNPALEDPGIRRTIEPPVPGESVDALFEALADERRYRLLSLVDGTEGPVELREAATRVAAWERGSAAETVTERAVETVYTELWHAHLPKIRNADLVEFDPEAETITFDGHPALPSQWLRPGEDHNTAGA